MHTEPTIRHKNFNSLIIYENCILNKYMHRESKYIVSRIHDQNTKKNSKSRTYHENNIIIHI